MQTYTVPPYYALLNNFTYFLHIFYITENYKPPNLLQKWKTMGKKRVVEVFLIMLLQKIRKQE